jgi:alkanesulfonate monooxygenase SsuD/methylene tetrahydromethanopterin reductase-like flavin-dependent oxidoreductase (luciferase family)
MTNNFENSSGSLRTRSIRERVGLAVDGSNSAAAVKSIVAAEDAGILQVWMTQIPTWPDTMTTLAAAAEKTTTVNLGTSIVPTYPRHPLVMAQQALAIHDLAPGRFRLGIGPSHRFLIEDMYGLQHSKPLAHLRDMLKFYVLHSGMEKLIIMESFIMKPRFHVRLRYLSLSQHLERKLFN